MLNNFYYDKNPLTKNQVEEPEKGASKKILKNGKMTAINDVIHHKWDMI